MSLCVSPHGDSYNKAINYSNTDNRPTVLCVHVIWKTGVLEKHFTDSDIVVCANPFKFKHVG